MARKINGVWYLSANESSDILRVQYQTFKRWVRIGQRMGIVVKGDDRVSQTIPVKIDTLVTEDGFLVYRGRSVCELAKELDRPVSFRRLRRAIAQAHSREYWYSPFVRGTYQHVENGTIWHIWELLKVEGTHHRCVKRQLLAGEGLTTDLMLYKHFVAAVRTKKLKLIKSVHVSAPVPLCLVQNQEPGGLETDE
jgi:hypothetical protein